MAYESEPLVLIGESTAQRIHDWLADNAYAAALNGQDAVVVEINQLRHVLCTTADVRDLIDGITDRVQQTYDADELDDIAVRLRRLLAVVRHRTADHHVTEQAVG